MSNLTTYGSSTEGYNASGGFTPTSGGYNYTGGQENSSHTSLWDMVMTWDALHWIVGWIEGLTFAMLGYFSCKCFCPERRRLRVILAILVFAIGLWAYPFVMITGAFLPFFVCFFSLFCPWCYKNCGCQKLVDWVTFKERRQNARRNKRMLLERALSNPSWRRRSWLVVLRARRTRPLQTRRWRCTRGGCVLPLTTADETITANDSWPSGADDSFQQIVMKVVDLHEEELFRSIVFYI